MSNPTQTPTATANYYAAIRFDINDCSDGETVVKRKKEGKNQMDEEATVETAFSVWGSDEESVLDKGVGGLDLAHSDKNCVNGRENARERPALIMIANKGDFGATEKCVFSEPTNSSSVSRKKVVQPLQSQPLQTRQPVQSRCSHFQS